MGMMKKAQAVQAKLQEAQEELGRVEVEGQSGGGMVSLTLTAKGELKGVRIDVSLLTPADKEMLEDLIIAAFAAWLIFAYNSLVRLRNEVENSWRQMASV